MADALSQAFNNNVTQHEFATNEAPVIPFSGMDRTHTYQTTFDAGYLIPFYIDEVVPGDTFEIHNSLFARLATPVVPFMDNLYLDTHFFFVPYRLVWNNWEKMHGAKDNPDDSTDYMTPVITIPKGTVNQTLADYFGIPTYLENDIEVNSLPFRAYNLVWNEWFRDANVMDSVKVEKGDADDYNNYTLLRRSKRHDYFTSALPWPQAGDPVTIGVGGLAPVVYSPSSPASITSGGSTFTSVKADHQIMGEQIRLRKSADNAEYWDINGDTSGSDMSARSMWSLSADLSEASSISINQLRELITLQRIKEADARGGSQRYTSMIEAHFGVKNPDLRMFRPQLLGSSTTPLQIYSVAQTSETTADSRQGTLAAYGIATNNNGYICKSSFGEYGIVIGLVSVRSSLRYQYGLDRMWSRRTRFDYYYPEFANLGEQTILNKEIYCQGTDDDEKVFGYQERNAEYRYHSSMITGKLRSNDPQSLDVWHLAQSFDNLPTLSKEFIEENPPVDRVIGVQDEPQFKLDAQVNLRCYRPIPVQSVPGLERI